MPARVGWSTNSQGWCVATVTIALRPVFIALMRERATSWRWLGFANGHPLGAFDGLTNAKRHAPTVAKEHFR